MQILEQQKVAAPQAPAVPRRGWRPQFNLLRWFSLASFLIIAAVALGLGYISTRFVVDESIERDSMLTAQFIQAIGEAEVRHAGISPGRTMGEMLDPRLTMPIPTSTPKPGPPRASSFSTMWSICRTSCWRRCMPWTARWSGRPTPS